MKKSNVTRLEPKPAPEFRPRFTREGLDSLINVLVNRTVRSLREREAAQHRTSEHSD